MNITLHLWELPTFFQRCLYLPCSSFHTTKQKWEGILPVSNKNKLLQFHRSKNISDVTTLLTFNWTSIKTAWNLIARNGPIGRSLTAPNRSFRWRAPLLFHALLRPWGYRNVKIVGQVLKSWWQLRSFRWQLMASRRVASQQCSWRRMGWHGLGEKWKGHFNDKFGFNFSPILSEKLQLVPFFSHFFSVIVYETTSRQCYVSIWVLLCLWRVEKSSAAAW